VACEAADREPLVNASHEFTLALDLEEAAAASIDEAQLPKVDPRDRFEVRPKYQVVTKTGVAVADIGIIAPKHEPVTLLLAAELEAHDPGGSGPPKFRTLATTTPFALASPSQFRPAGPPALNSAQYASALDEVKKFGSATSTVRTPFQTETAKFWQLDTPIGIWDRVADWLAQENHFNLMRTARLLAFLNVAEADAAIAVWDAKNKFNFWRPVTAIGDPTWAPLLITPYFQEYPSGHSGVSSAAATILASFFGPDAQFTVTSNGLPGVSRSFTSFSGAIAEVADARVFAGFHFRFSCNDATQMGVQVANYAESTLMQKVSDESD
jgi:membrane-associated phospholipid phosphatase